MRNTLTAVTEFFGLDDEWVRPLPAGWLKRDVLLALTFFVGAVAGLEAWRSLGVGGDDLWPRWALYLSSAIGAGLLAFRRRFPIAVMLLAATHMFVMGLVQTPVMSSVAMQGAYFFAILTALAWAPDRKLVALAAAGVVLFMFGWLTVQWSLASMRDDYLNTLGAQPDAARDPLFGAFTGMVVQMLLINILYFATAVIAGASSWRGARTQAFAHEQAATIARQADQLTDQAVVAERLRIARELHDVVAHHVAAIGVQAAAARKLMTKDTGRAAQSLTNVETSSREAVTQMRSLLGTLREGGAAANPATGPSSPQHNPKPGISDIACLTQGLGDGAFTVTLTDLIAHPDAIPDNVGHSLYRTVQEALANVRRHSTATAASVALRDGDETGRRYVEAEILDEGRPRTGTSGSGLGLLGMRERVTAHRGSAEIGPRLTGGYRVRVRLPIDAGAHEET